MIDRTARDNMAELLRHLASGTMTTGEFADAMPKESRDRVIKEAVRLYYDLYEDLFYKEWRRRNREGEDGRQDEQCLDCRFKGELAMDARDLGDVERTILFLQTDLEYESTDGSTVLKWWQAILLAPVLVVGLLFVAVVACVLIFISPWLALIVVGVAPVLILFLVGLVRGERPWECILPFQRRADFDLAKASPRLLAGKQEHRDQ